MAPSEILYLILIWGFLTFLFPFPFPFPQKSWHHRVRPWSLKPLIFKAQCNHLYLVIWKQASVLFQKTSIYQKSNAILRMLPTNWRYMPNLEPSRSLMCWSSCCRSQQETPKSCKIKTCVLFFCFQECYHFHDCHDSGIEISNYCLLSVEHSIWLKIVPIH